MDLEEKHVNTLSATLETGADGWTNAVDLQPLFFKMTLELMTEFLYGCLPSQLAQKHDAPDREEFEFHFDAGKWFIGARVASGNFYWLFPSFVFSHHCKKVHQYVDQFVSARLQRGQTQHTTKPPIQEPAVKSKFVLLDEVAKLTTNALEIRNETLNVLSAGRDTTASLLGWIFYLLSRYPRVYNQLRAKVLAEIGSDASSIDFAKLRSCHYLQHCLNETLRIIGVVPMLDRICLEDVVLPRGGGPNGSEPVFLAKGERVLVATFAMQHRCDIWGDDPDVFRPERWENRRAGFEFLPFGGGHRKCIGRELPPFASFRYHGSD